jgi:acetyl esterase/lipase
MLIRSLPIVIVCLWICGVATPATSAQDQPPTPSGAGSLGSPAPAPARTGPEYDPLDFGRPEQLNTPPDVFDVPYATDHFRQKLDLYFPVGFTPPYPLVIYIHGGGWNFGDKDRIKPWVDDILSRGFAAASINYRWADDAVFPAQIHDCKGAVRWLRANAATYDLDPDRFAVFGDSAGGHLASLLTTSADAPEIEGTVGGNLEYSSRMQACGHFFGATDLIELRIFRGQDMSESGLMGFSVGELIENIDDPAYAGQLALVESANPVNYVTPDDPPFYIVHGEDDIVIPPSQSQLLADALALNFVPYTFALLPNTGHEAPFEQFQAAFDLFEQVLMEPALFGDLNHDGFVGVPDLLLVLGGWGVCPESPAACPADVNGDGQVSVLDLLLILAEWS